MSVFSKVRGIFKIKKDSLSKEELLNIEERLIEADFSLATIGEVITPDLNKLHSSEELINKIKERLIKILYPKQKVLNINTKPFVIFISGVNGGGKTTTIAKLSNFFISQNKKVLIGACDTFRAAAVEQLDFWAKKVGSFIEKPLKEKEDPSAVAYRALKRAKDESFDVLILDTSGRLQNNVSLMEELKKIQSVLTKVDKTKPDLSLIVIDGSSGQNTVLQVKEFSKFINLDGVIVTKLDSSSRGGMVFTIAKELDFGIYFVTMGEGLDDFTPFKADEFVNSILYDKN